MITQADLHCSRGPVSSMPGSSHFLPEGSMCDQHDDRPAVRRAQGETDSFGCEYVLQCAECMEASRAYVPDPGFCSQCKTLQVLGAWRDPDEGRAGPVYHYCRECRIKLNTAYAKDNDTGDYYGDHFFDDHDDGDDDAFDAGYKSHAEQTPKTYSQWLFTFRWHDTGERVRNRDGSGNLVMPEREALKFLNRHKSRLRGRRIDLEVYSSLY